MEALIGLLTVLLVGFSGAMIWMLIIGIVLVVAKKPNKFIWKWFLIFGVFAVLSYLGIILL